MEINKDIKDKIDLASKEIKGIFISPEKLSIEEAKNIIKRYVAAIEGNFLPWMSGASISARSIFGKFISDENLYVEIKEDHPGMLRKFSKSCNAEPNKEDFEYVEKEVNELRKIVGELSGIKSLAIMATLENTSLVFVPYLKEISKKLHCKDSYYLDKHGEADIKHANQFLEALTEEEKYDYLESQKEIQEAIKNTTNLLKRIFIK